jgi:hypothetical protein
MSTFPAYYTVSCQNGALQYRVDSAAERIALERFLAGETDAQNLVAEIVDAVPWEAVDAAGVDRERYRHWLSTSTYHLGLWCQRPGTLTRHGDVQT